MGCKSGKRGLTGKPSIKKSKELIHKIEEHKFDLEFVQFKGKGVYNNDGNEQSFKFDIRIKKDSIVWIEISDPFIGIKAARGFVTQDSMILVNKIDRSYMTGSIAELEKELNAELDFELLQNALLGRTMRSLDKGENHQMAALEALYSLYYFPEIDPLFKYGQPNYYFEIDPGSFQIVKQQATDGGHRFMASYANYKEVDKKQYLPQNVSVEVAYNNNLKLSLQFNSISVNQPLKFPIKVSSKYTRL